MPKERSVEKDIVSFCGWDFLLELIKCSPTLTHKGIIAGLFLTGCRVSELIMLERKNVRLNVHPKLILIENAPVIKRYSRKLKKRFVEHRTFPINKDEPLVPYFLEYVESKKGKLYPFSRTSIYYQVQKVGKILNEDVPFSNIHSSQLYPHWFRAQRARQLRAEYGFTDEELRDWFGWKFAKDGMPAVYGRYSWIEFARKYGVDVFHRDP